MVFYIPNTAYFERICILNNPLKFFICAIETKFLQAVAQDIISDLPPQI
jgi:hypothetical protein